MNGHFINKTSDFVLKGNICYSTSPTNICTKENSYVVCQNGISCGVFEELPDIYKNFPVYDYSDEIIIPGMIDLHIHAPQYPFKGFGMDLELLDWLNTQTFPEEIKYSNIEYAKEKYSIFADNMKKSATTRACIFGTVHRKSTELLMELMENSGLITYVGKVNMDRNCPDELSEIDAENSAKETCLWIENTLKKFKHTRPILTPRFIPSCTNELLEKLQEIQITYNLPVQSHLSENPDEVEWVKELCPESDFYGDAYDRYGLFGKSANTIMAHCIYSSPDEMTRMLKNEVYVAHCPASNINLSSGIAPIRKYLDAGLHIGLGSDVAGGHTESIFRAITDAIQVSKLYWRIIDNSYRPLTFQEAFYLASKGGGSFFGKVGSFEKGYEFDAIIIDDRKMTDSQKIPPLQRLERSIYSLCDKDGISGKFVRGVKII